MKNNENKSAYLQGYKAHDDKKGTLDNPFPKSNDEKSDYQKWLAGWKQANFDWQFCAL